MVMVHRVFRRELRLLPALVVAVPAGRPDRVRLLADAVVDLLHGLHVHHTGEDELLWPKLLERAAPDAALIERMQAQHERIAIHADAAGVLAEKWRDDGDPGTGGRLAGELSRLGTVLNEHLAEEERHILPLAAAHLSVAEWRRLGEHGMAGVGKAKLLMTLGAILEEATDLERATFLAKVPLPGRLAWHLVGRRRYRRVIAERRSSTATRT
jgi:hemerythrin-like domain-containing protein